MPEKDEKTSQSGSEIEGYLTDDERKKLISNLHRVLVWVGVKVPVEFWIDRGTLDEEMEKHHQTERDLPPEIHLHQTASDSEIDLNHIIWRLITEKEITEQERGQIEELIDLLKKKEKLDEDKLREQKMTLKQANILFEEAAGAIRALLDLKDLLQKKDRSDETHEQIQHKVNEAKKWNDLMEKVKRD